MQHARGIEASDKGVGISQHRMSIEWTWGADTSILEKKDGRGTPGEGMLGVRRWVAT